MPPFSFPLTFRKATRCYVGESPKAFTISKYPRALELRNLGHCSRSSIHSGALRRECWVCLFITPLSSFCFRQLSPPCK